MPFNPIVIEEQTTGLAIMYNVPESVSKSTFSSNKRDYHCGYLMRTNATWVVHNCVGNIDDLEMIIERVNAFAAEYAEE